MYFRIGKNAASEADSLRVKAIALCAHLEKLCASAVCVIRSGEMDSLEMLESRKSIVLEELLRMLKLPALLDPPNLIPEILDRVKSALQAESEAVAARAGQLGAKLALLRSRAQDLSKLRSSYANSEFSAPCKLSASLATIIARG